MYFVINKTIIPLYKAFGLLLLGCIIGLLLSHYGIVFERIRVDVKVNVVEKDYETVNGDRIAPQLSLESALNHKYVVPNVVHFTWFTDDDSQQMMSFFDYMTVLSVYRIQRPDEIQFHCNRLPDSDDIWWAQLWKEIPIRIVYHDKPKLLQGLQLSDAQNQFSKIAALKVLLEYGGIFVDWNVLVVRSLDPLRHHNVTLGKVSTTTLSTDVVAACRNATFLQILVNSYQYASTETSGDQKMGRKEGAATDETSDIAQSAYKLSLQHPTLLNTVPIEMTLSTKAVPRPAVDSPQQQQQQQLSTQPFVLRVPPSYKRTPRSESTDELVNSVSGSVGAAMRLIYYGLKK